MPLFGGMNIFEMPHRDVVRIEPDDLEYQRLPAWAQLRLRVPSNQQPHLAIMLSQSGDVWRFSSADRAIMTIPDGRLFICVTLATSDYIPDAPLDWRGERHWGVPTPGMSLETCLPIDAIAGHLDYVAP